MINDAIERLEENDIDIETLAINNHAPQKAVYIIVNTDMEAKVISTNRFSFNSKYCLMDFYSRILNTNKALDRKRKILSNNYLTFFTKSPDKLTDSIIDGYYERCEAPTDIYKNWIKENLDFLIKNSVKDTLIKVFFDTDIKYYVELGKKYFYSASINKIKGQTININGKICGAPLTVNLNAKKAYEISRFLKLHSPSLVTQEQGYKVKCFLDYLSSLSRSGYDAIYISEKGKIYAASFKTNTLPDIFNDYNLMLFTFSLTSKGELKIHDMSNVPCYSKFL